jgi:uridine phosphorylase
LNAHSGEHSNKRGQATDWGGEIVRIATGWLVERDAHPQFPARVLLPLENPDLHDPKPFRAPLSGVRSHRGVTIGRMGRERIGVVDSKFGAAAVVMAVDVFAELGAKCVVGVGFCGGLQHEVSCGDLVIPVASFRDESVSARYGEPGECIEADSGLLEMLPQELTSIGRRHHTGLVVTTDVATREDAQFVRDWAARGALGVDMETSALLAAAARVGIRAATVLVASDNAASFAPAESVALAAGTEDAVKAALGALARVCA